MNNLEDRLRAALEETAEEIAARGVPPLRLNRARRFRLPGVTDRHRWAAWLTPLAAAAAVAAVILASVAVSGTIGSGSQPGAPPGPAGIPRYYVALRFSSLGSCCRVGQPLIPRTRAVVVSTATGAVLATIAPPLRGTTFAGVSGAADDRTFVLGVQPYGSLLPTRPTRFYLLRISPLGPRAVSPFPTLKPRPLRTIRPTSEPTPSASPSPTGSASRYASPSPSISLSPTGSASPYASPSPSISPSPAGSASPSASPSPSGSPGPFFSPGPAGMRARLSPLPIPPDTAGVRSFALSPQGTSLAVLDAVGLHVFNLATGARRTLETSCPPYGGIALGGATSDAMLSWTADGRRLTTACNTNPAGVWLLDTTAPGGNLVKDGQRLVPGPPVLPCGQPPWHQVLLTRDARTVVGVLEVRDPHCPVAFSPIQELAEFSARTGKLLRVLNRMPVWNQSDFEQVLWASPSGRSLLVSDTVPYQGRRRAFFLLNNAGVLTGHHFAPLPRWSLSTIAAAW